MPRHPDPDLEERILKAAHTLWKRGGERALTMRAVALAAHTNTPAGRLGGKAADHTQLALALWAILHGTSMLLVSKAIPEGHEDELRRACRSAVKALLDGVSQFTGTRAAERA